MCFCFYALMAGPSNYCQTVNWSCDRKKFVDHRCKMFEVSWNVPVKFPEQ